MAKRSATSNIVAGAFVVLSLALAVGVSFLLAEKGAGPKAQSLSVRFPVSTGAPGIEPSSPVRLGGQTIGRVAKVRFESEANGPATGVLVDLEVRGDIAIHQDARVTLERPLLGSLSSINITHAGSLAAPRLAKGAVVDGSPAGGLLAQAGLGDEQIKLVISTLKNLESSVAKLDGLIERGAPDIEATLKEVRTFAQDARASFAAWDKSITSTLANVETASVKLDPILNETQKLIADASAIVQENRGRIDSMISSLDRSATKFETQTLVTLDSALKQAGLAMDEAGAAIREVGQLVQEQGPSLNRTLANMRIMSDQLKLTAIEVRSQPWRLLHQPTTKELSTQIVYDATRSYAEAASDVRAAAESLSAARGSADDAVLAELVESLRASMQEFDKAESALLDTLLREQSK